MKSILLFIAFAGCLAFDKNSMLKHNKISKEPVGHLSVLSICDECKTFVSRMSDAAKDSTKMDELKMVLKIFCQGTGYVDECLMLVSKVDLVVDKVAPYLNDTLKVCRKFHMCSNSRLEAFHRIGLLYAKRAMNKVEGMKDLLCEECQFAARELKMIVEDNEKQKQIRNFLSVNICLHLGRYRGMCDTLLEQFLPELFQELNLLLNDPKQVCIDAGFCPHTAPQRNLVGFAGFLSRL